MAISARERRHFEAIRRAKDAEREQRLAEALSKHPVERIIEGLELGAVEGGKAVEAELDKRALAQAGLARRARALGMRGKRDGRQGPPE